MPSVYELHLRSTSLRDPVPRALRRLDRGTRPGESSGERRLRRLRAVLGERGIRRDSLH